MSMLARRLFVSPLAALALTFAGCTAPCPERVILDTPRDTIESFHRAFACDDRELEYRCLSEDVREAFHGLPGYAIGRAWFRQEHAALVLLLSFSELGDRLSVEPGADPNRALARIRAGDGEELRVPLVNEPEYLLYHPDGSTTRMYADEVLAQRLGPSEVAVAILDRDLKSIADKPIERIEIRSRWVIADVPGLAEAIDASRSPGAGAP